MVTSGMNVLGCLRTRTSARCDQPGSGHLHIDCGLNWPVKSGIGIREALGTIPLISADTGSLTIHWRSRLISPTAIVCRAAETRSTRLTMTGTHASQTATKHQVGKAIRSAI